MTWLDRLIAEGGFHSHLSTRQDGSAHGGHGWDSTLEALCKGLLPVEAHALREERAGILEHMAGMSRVEAESRAGIIPPG